MDTPSYIGTKQDRREEFYMNQLKNKAEKKLSRREFITFTELLSKLKDIKRNGE